MNLESGVFSFYCASNEAMYLAASTDIVATVDTLVNALNEDKAYDRNLQKDWSHHGGEEFEISTLEELEQPTKEGLEKLLQAWLIRIPFANKLSLAE